MNAPASCDKAIENLPPTDIVGFDSLAELALDLRWTWNHAAAEMWQRLDPKPPCPRCAPRRTIRRA